ncbi:hypothetical protein HAX54_036205, partial [Datura stramonium]|nr:hypothetical protein [Datura stramonium]
MHIAGFSINHESSAGCTPSYSFWRDKRLDGASRYSSQWSLIPFRCIPLSSNHLSSGVSPRGTTNGSLVLPELYLQPYESYLKPTYHTMTLDPQLCINDPLFAPVDHQLSSFNFQHSPTMTVVSHDRLYHDTPLA